MKLHIAQQDEPEATAKTHAKPLTVYDEKPPKLEFSRWIVGKETNCFRFLPIVPNRPIVVRMEMPVNLPPQQKAVFFVSIPVWIRIIAEQKPPVELCEIPTVTRSNSWFGDTVSGQLCYSLITHARRDISAKKTERYRMVCPVEIHNKATTVLNIDHLCVHVEHLDIYEGSPRLWTTQVRISYLGQGQGQPDRISARTAGLRAGTDAAECGSENRIKKPCWTQSFSNFKFIPSI